MFRGNGRGIRTWTQAFRTLLLALLIITILRILTSSQKKKTGTWWCLFSSWQRYKDSNLKWRSQSPECYRYTIPLYFAVLSYSNNYYITKFEFVKSKFALFLFFHNSYVFSKEIKAHSLTCYSWHKSLGIEFFKFLQRQVCIYYYRFIRK